MMASYRDRAVRLAFPLVLGAALLLGPLVLAQNIPVTVAERERALQLLQRGRERAAARDDRGAIAALNQAILLAPDIAEPYFERGVIRARLEDEFGALADFNDAILRDPRHARAYLQRAGVLFGLGGNAEAIVDLRQAAQLFEAMGDREGYERTRALLEHFNRTLPISEGQ